ncbi:hypothetical protein LDDCCGHA_0166 [Methylobacterium oxalidis]|nr:hypothetical protein LDDCCGHA_0166 [Methylobacterium oxalidis]
MADQPSSGSLPPAKPSFRNLDAHAAPDWSPIPSPRTNR